MLFVNDSVTVPGGVVSLYVFSTAADRKRKIPCAQPRNHYSILRTIRRSRVRGAEELDDGSSCIHANQWRLNLPPQASLHTILSRLLFWVLAGNEV